MKMNQIVFPLALALVAALAVTGCKKGTPKLTTLPGQRAQVGGGGENPETIKTGIPLEDPTKGIGKSDGPQSLADRGGFDNYTPDPAALANYTVHFAFDSATVKNNEQSNLDAVANALKASASDKLRIEGNCDERGTEEYNRALGERRADALREALVKAGIGGDRIQTISYGKDKPADPKHDEAAWSKNRRGDFILLHPKAGV